MSATTADRAQWLEARQRSIGSSDAPEILGIGWSGRDGPGRVYRSKIDPVDPRLPSAGPLRRGIDLEPIAARLYQEVMGVELSVVPIRFHPAQPWRSASNDRIRPDDGRHVEIKTILSFGDEWGEQGSADVPPEVDAQVQHQMDVAGTDSIDVFALEVMSWQHRVFRVERRPDFLAHLVDVEREFWERHVIPRVPPGDEWHAYVKPLPKLVEGSVATLKDDWAALLDLRDRIGREIKDAEARVKDLTAQVRAAMGVNERAIAGRWMVKRVRVSGAQVSYYRDPYERLDIRRRKDDE